MEEMKRREEKDNEKEWERGERGVWSSDVIVYIFTGLKEVGVFQSSSIDCEKVKKIRDSIDAGKNIAKERERFLTKLTLKGNGVDVQLHEHLKYIDVHTVAGLLKQYLREFPQPIIPSDVFDMLLASLRTFPNERKEEKIKEERLMKWREGRKEERNGKSKGRDIRTHILSKIKGAKKYEKQFTSFRVTATIY